jgi:hypothetical protein
MSRNPHSEKVIQRYILDAIKSVIPLEETEDFIKFFNDWSKYQHTPTYGAHWIIEVGVYEEEWIRTVHVRFCMPRIGLTFLSFAFSSYPACCGITMFHHFNTNCKEENQELFDKVFKAIMQGYSQAEDIKEGSGRIETVMVEPTPKVKGNYMVDPQEPVENPTIKYPQFYKYWHKYARKVNTRLMYNKNSGNMLHNMEIIL